MINIKPSEFEQNLNCYINETVKDDQIIKISTELGKAVMISEKEFCKLLRFVSSDIDAKAWQEIMMGAKESINNCVPADKVNW
ncbi:MAG: hypothetical protein IJA41_04525 [Clostridia bacterium]|nr:hypothetical protein [Clostridia bacterium]